MSRAAAFVIGTMALAAATYLAVRPERSTTVRRALEGSVTLPQYLSTLTSHQEDWGGALDRARTAQGMGPPIVPPGGSWTLLALVQEWCVDSQEVIPYVAELTSQVPRLALRLIPADEVPDLSFNYRTPDGRTATPTLLLLDSRNAVVGCWVERPADLEVAVAAGEVDGSAAIRRWYAADAGREITSEIANMLERAFAGEPACPGQFAAPLAQAPGPWETRPWRTPVGTRS